MAIGSNSSGYKLNIRRVKLAAARKYKAIPHFKILKKPLVEAIADNASLIRRGKFGRIPQRKARRFIEKQYREKTGKKMILTTRADVKRELKSLGEGGDVPKSARKQANKQFDKKGEPILTEQQKKINVRLGRIGDKVAYLDRYNKQSNGRLTREDLRASTLMRVSKEHLGIKQEAGGFANDLSKNSKTSVSSPDNLDQKKSNSLGLGSSLGASPGRRPFGISPGKKPFL